VDDAPYPRVLFEDMAEELYDELAPLVGTAKRIEHDDPIHASDWDLLVTCAWDAGCREPPLHVLSFGAEQLDFIHKDGWGSALRKANVTRARNGDVAHGVAPALADLLRRTVVDQIGPDEKSTWMVAWGDPFAAPDNEDELTDDLGGACTPLVHVGQERFVYALQRPRDPQQEHSALCWALPQETTGPREWLLYVLDQLRAYDPDRFPSDPAWQSRGTWAPPALAQAQGRRAALEADWVRAQAAFEEQRSAFVAEIDAETRDAIAGVWRLLTAQSDDLVAAVSDALTDLGFEVRDMDAHHDQKTGAKLEDLRVTDTDDRSWECLVEVKG
jgi:hypothetical protein